MSLNAETCNPLPGLKYGANRHSTHEGFEAVTARYGSAGTSDGCEWGTDANSGAIFTPGICQGELAACQFPTSSRPH
jgi:hypothetical protein